ncbi:MAG: leucine-rich repeat domain-containing protein [Firmicutes bacterium]|nr:leucine-rich repeat domain-containing protein [Bacillota bacterium]
MIDSKPHKDKSEIVLDKNLARKIALEKALETSRFCIIDGVATRYSDRYSEGDVEIPNGVVSIGANAFENCHLSSIFISKTVRSIASGAFSRCTKLESVDFEEGSALRTIDEKAFYGCINLRKIQLPFSLKTIGVDAFCGCEELEHIDFPHELTNVYGGAFSALVDKDRGVHSAGLSCVKFPESLKKLGLSAFKGSQNLREVSFEKGCRLEVIEKDTFAPVSVVRGGLSDIEKLDIPSGLRYITIPTSVKSIEERAFYDCKNLGVVEFEEGSQLQTIGKEAFFRCWLIKELKIPPLVENISEDAFMHWEANQKILITKPLYKKYKDFWKSLKAEIEIYKPKK